MSLSGGEYENICRYIYIYIYDYLQNSPFFLPFLQLIFCFYPLVSKVDRACTPVLESVKYTIKIQRMDNQEPSSFLVGLAYTVTTGLNRLIELLGQLPGGGLVINYIKASHKNDPWRTVLEILLAVFAVTYTLASRYSQDDRDKMLLSEREVDELIEEWEPEPIVAEVAEEEKWQASTIPLVEGSIGKRVTIHNNGKKTEQVLNLASSDHLGMGANEFVKEQAIGCISSVGVGACSAPNFYGNQSVHVQFCNHLADFLGAEDGIIYGQDFSTPISVLPCFLKRGDVVIADKGISVGLQKAVLISRCSIEWYDHNDMDHLEEILQPLCEDLKQGPLNRRFIVTEGLFENYGDSPDLKRLVEIKNKYKFRLLLDESNSFGVLGDNGRGLPEVYNIPRKDIEITIGSMARAFGASGGFCVGEKGMIYHQILTSNAYVFSASLPPYAAKACSATIQLLSESEKEGQINPYVKPLRENSEYFHSLFLNSKELKNYVTINSSSDSATLHLGINPKIRQEAGFPDAYGGPGSVVSMAARKGKEELYFDSAYNLESYKMQKIINDCIESKVLFTRSKRILHHELFPVVPDLIFKISAHHTKDELDYAFDISRSAIIKNLDSWKISSN